MSEWRDLSIDSCEANVRADQRSGVGSSLSGCQVAVTFLVMARACKPDMHYSASKKGLTLRACGVFLIPHGY